jgi:hypothetical protein
MKLSLSLEETTKLNHYSAKKKKKPHTQQTVENLPVYAKPWVQPPVTRGKKNASNIYPDFPT